MIDDETKIINELSDFFADIYQCYFNLLYLFQIIEIAGFGTLRNLLPELVLFID